MLEPSQRPTWIHLRGDVCGFLRHMPGALLLGTVGWMPITAAAQPSGCPDVCALYSDLLMAPERALIGSIRTIEKVAKPAPGPRHTRGHWMQRDVFLGSAAFDTTFYVGKGLVQRIEMVSTASQAQCRARTPWADTIAAMEAWQNQGAVTGKIESGDNVQQSVHWTAEDVDVNMYLSITTASCVTQVTFKKREVKDASQL